MQHIFEHPITIRRAILVCAVLFALLALRYLLASTVSFVPSFPKAESDATAVIRLSEPNLSEARSANLMGKYEPPPPIVEDTVEIAPEPTPQPVVSEPPKEPLDVKVLGLISSTKQNLRYAILQEGGKTQKGFGVGDKLEDGETIIKNIDGDKIIFDRDGVEEVAYLYKPKGSTRPAIPPSDDPFSDPFDDNESPFPSPFGEANDPNIRPQQFDASSIQSDATQDPFGNDLGDAGLIEDNNFFDNDGLSEAELAAQQLMENGFEGGNDFTPPSPGVFDSPQPNGSRPSLNNGVSPNSPSFEDELQPIQDGQDPFADDSNFAPVNSNLQ